MLPLSIVAVAIVAVVVLTSARKAFDLDRSAIGFDGLVTWLSKNGVEARTFAGGDRLTGDRVGLRVYPLALRRATHQGRPMPAVDRDDRGNASRHLHRP